MKWKCRNCGGDVVWGVYALKWVHRSSFVHCGDNEGNVAVPVADDGVIAVWNTHEM